MKKASDIKNRAAAFYGRSGTGKTTIACSYPGPLLLLDIMDKGTDSVSDVKNLDVMEIGEWDDFEDAYWWLKANPNKYKTVIIDTVTNLQQLAVLMVLSKKKKANLEKAGDWGTMSRRQWGDVASKMKTFITNVRNLPMNAVFIAQDRIFNFNDEDEDEELEDQLLPEVGPQLSPAVAKHLNASVSTIGNTFIRRRRTPDKKIRDKIIKGKEITEYCMRLGPSPIYITKLRKPKHIEPPSVLVDPSYKEILSLVKGDK